jgi:hypothetical protein
MPLRDAYFYGYQYPYYYVLTFEGSRSRFTGVSKDVGRENMTIVLGLKASGFANAMMGAFSFSSMYQFE